MLGAGDNEFDFTAQSEWYDLLIANCNAAVVGWSNAQGEFGVAAPLYQDAISAYAFAEVMLDWAGDPGDGGDGGDDGDGDGDGGE